MSVRWINTLGTKVQNQARVTQKHTHRGGRAASCYTKQISNKTDRQEVEIKVKNHTLKAPDVQLVLECALFQHNIDSLLKLSLTTTLKKESVKFFFYV